MMGCKGLHCGGCSDGGGGAALAVIVVLAIAGAAAHAAWHTIMGVVDTLLLAAEITALVLIGSIGLAVLAFVAACVRNRATVGRSRPRMPSHVRSVRLHNRDVNPLPDPARRSLSAGPAVPELPIVIDSTTGTPTEPPKDYIWRTR